MLYSEILQWNACGCTQALSMLLRGLVHRKFTPDDLDFTAFTLLLTINFSRLFSASFDLIELEKQLLCGTSAHNHFNIWIPLKYQ